MTCERYVIIFRDSGDWSSPSDYITEEIEQIIEARQVEIINDKEARCRSDCAGPRDN